MTASSPGSFPAADPDNALAPEPRDTLRLAEALLFASPQPLTVAELRHHLPEDCNVQAVLKQLQADYQGRGVELVRRGPGWAFRTAADLAGRLRLETVTPRKLSRQAMEVLAIIAYHQPITRAEIEEIRGVSLSRGSLDQVLEAGWVRPAGRRDTPGRPLQWTVTAGFLDHFGLVSLDDLPGLEELRAGGLLDRSPLARYAIRAADDDVQTLPDPADSPED